jgi:tetratricopeptide (TPR) repeat protein
MPHLRAALQALRTLGGANDLVAAQVEANCVKWLVITRQMSYEEGRSIIETSRRSLAERGAQVPELALARLDFHLGQIAADWGDAEGAYRLLEPAVSRLKPTLQSPWPLFRLMTTLAAAAAETGRHGQAEALFDEAISIGRRAASADSPWLAETYVNAAMNLAMQGRIDAAESMLAALPEIAPVRGQTRAPLRYRDAVRLARARLALDRGDPQSAIALLPAPGEAGADEAALADADDVFFDRRLLRGAAWCASGRPREGLLLMAAGVDRAARYGSPHRAALASWRARTAACALAAGQPQQARELAALARAAFDAQPGVAAWFRAPLLAVQARLGRR